MVMEFPVMYSIDYRGLVYM